MSNNPNVNSKSKSRKSSVSGSNDNLALATAIYALRHPRGRYDNTRASQLSGIPRSTLYEWRRNGIYVPDFSGDKPATWSYGDLLYLRLLAWLRQCGMERHTASKAVRSIKLQIIAGQEIRYFFADRHTLMVDEERTNRVTGQTILPFSDLSGLFRTFDILNPVPELGGGKLSRLWAPDLIMPSPMTFISPWVMAGDPCIAHTRIPTSSIYALKEERGLSSLEIVDLYPGLTVDSVDDAYLLERRLRNFDLPTSTAA